VRQEEGEAQVSVSANGHRQLRLFGAAMLLAVFGAVLPSVASAALPDDRGWELVSPVDKNGGAINAAGSVAGGGVLQASADGESVTYSSSTSFGAEAQSAPAGSQYLSTRGDSSWITKNLTVPIFSGSFGATPDGVPYQLFSTDLGRGLLLNGLHCRAQEGTCPVANPPLPGTTAPTGYQDYYLWNEGASFQALVGDVDVANLPYGPSNFDLAFVGASPDLGHVVLSTCSALIAGATEVPLAGGCDPGQPNLYEWSPATGLSPINSVPGAALAAPGTAVSADGSRVYWRNLTNANLFLRQGGSSKQVDVAAGGGGTFQMATPDGGVAFFLKAEHLWRYDASADAAADITPSGGVVGMLGASDDGEFAYYANGAGVFLWHEGATEKVAEALQAAEPSSYPPTTGASRVSADGDKLVFPSLAQLTDYNNANNKSGAPESEVYLYEAATEELRCVSCRPNGLRPGASSSIPGSNPNGSGPGATNSYKPRVLSADGRRIFFNSEDPLVSSDTNREIDVYQWEADGEGTCIKAAGCVTLISSGRAAGGATFVDASADGSDAFFVTDGSLVGSDPGAFDLYDARVGSGLEEELEEIPCFGDACQDLPSEPVDPGLATLVPGPGNPRITYVKHHRREPNHCRSKKSAKCHKGKSKGKGKGKGKAKNQKKGNR
jgi:hypothetical protein